eukprot:TRINITY_DN31639_c0_g1_i1.p1 TRINITY_DN31639_c0_g1~~TRINITY_DN31639_c0_g1_i1.p1  ORF type:complete len:187 (+),score=31.73 TRINITY_DN31639_c0_g1_i1:127-687(+)
MPRAQDSRTSEGDEEENFALIQGLEAAEEADDVSHSSGSLGRLSLGRGVASLIVLLSASACVALFTKAVLRPGGWLPGGTTLLDEEGKGQDAEFPLAPLADGYVRCGAIGQCRTDEKCCNGMCGVKYSSCCEGLFLCQAGGTCCGGACCGPRAVCCKGICGAPGANCTHGIVLAETFEPHGLMPYN